mgnify:CR=1 FL=1
MNVHLEQPLYHAGVSLEKCKALVMLVHGRHQTAQYMLSLVDRINMPQVHYVALQAANNSWYPQKFMAPLEQNEPHLQFALETYHTHITQLVQQGIAKSKIVLLGFSQGACLTAEYAVRHADRYGGILLFTGGVIGPEGTKWNYEGDFKGTPIFIGCSDQDEWVPEQRVHETAEIFKRMGADTTVKIYKGMGHIINDDEIEQARNILGQVIAQD